MQTPPLYAGLITELAESSPFLEGNLDHLHAMHGLIGTDGLEP